MIMSPLLHSHIEGDSCTLYLSQQQREGERKLFLHLFCFEQVEKGDGGPDMSGAALVVALVMQMSQRGSHTLVSLPTPAGVYSSECAGARVVEARWYKYSASDMYLERGEVEWGPLWGSGFSSGPALS